MQDKPAKLLGAFLEKKSRPASHGAVFFTGQGYWRFPCYATVDAALTLYRHKRTLLKWVFLTRQPETRETKRLPNVPVTKNRQSWLKY
jgi:hypothetical protein